jgi:hypothetical protein
MACILLASGTVAMLQAAGLILSGLHFLCPQGEMQRSHRWLDTIGVKPDITRGRS